MSIFTVNNFRASHAVSTYCLNCCSPDSVLFSCLSIPLYVTQRTSASISDSMMPGKTSIQSLSNDLLRDILDHIEADPDRSVSIDRRAYLSVESFRPPSSPPQPHAQDIGNFRLVCRRFADLGILHQFTRIATRFSPAGLQRLDHISSHSHLARHTKKFSYLIPDFYVEGWHESPKLFYRD